MGARLVRPRRKDGTMYGATASACEVEELSVDEGRRMFGGQVRDRLGIGPGEFLRRLDAGEYDDAEDEAVLRLRMLAPFGR